jgi:hypothetical protein
MGLNNTIKIRFIGDGEWTIDATIQVSKVTRDSRCYGAESEIRARLVPE